DRPCGLVSHLIGNRASFLCTKAPMPRVPETNFLQGITSVSGRDVQAIFRLRHQHRFCGTTPSITDFWTNRGKRPHLLPLCQVPSILAPVVLTPVRSLPSG